MAHDGMATGLQFMGVSWCSCSLFSCEISDHVWFLLPACRHNQYSLNLSTLSSCSRIRGWKREKINPHVISDMSKQPRLHRLPVFGELAWQDEQNLHRVFPFVSLTLLVFFFFSFSSSFEKQKPLKEFFNYFFISTCLKWDTGWTLVSQNNEILFLFGFALGLRGSPEDFLADDQNEKRKKNPIISILNSCQYNFQRFVVWCTELACRFVISHICALISFKQ